MNAGLQTPFSAKVSAGEYTHGDDCACANKPHFLLGLPTAYSSAFGPSLQNRMPLMQSRDKRHYSL